MRAGLREGILQLRGNLQQLTRNLLLFVNRSVESSRSFGLLTLSGGRATELNIERRKIATIMDEIKHFTTETRGAFVEIKLLALKVIKGGVLAPRPTPQYLFFSPAMKQCVRILYALTLMRV